MNSSTVWPSCCLGWSRRVPPWTPPSIPTSCGRNSRHYALEAEGESFQQAMGSHGLWAIHRWTRLHRSSSTKERKNCGYMTQDTLGSAGLVAEALRFPWPMLRLQPYWYWPLSWCIPCLSISLGSMTNWFCIFVAFVTQVLYNGIETLYITIHKLQNGKVGRCLYCTGSHVLLALHMVVVVATHQPLSFVLCSYSMDVDSHSLANHIDHRCQDQLVSYVPQ